MHCRNYQPAPLSRRDMLVRCANGFGAVALSTLLADAAAGAAPPTLRDRSPLAPKPSHFKAKAKSVIFLFMDGGPSQMDTFDPKPRLDREHGQRIKTRVEPTQFNNVGTVLKSPVEVPQLRQERHPGQRPVPARGDLRRRPGRRPLDGGELLRTHQRELLHPLRPRTAGPAEHGGVGDLRSGQRVPEPARLHRPQQRHDSARRHGLLQQRLPARRLPGLAVPARRRCPSPTCGRPRQTHGCRSASCHCCASSTAPSCERMGGDDKLESAIANYELAFRMQTAVPELMDVQGRDGGDPQALRPGRSRRRTRIFGRQCLVARRLVERGVRFVELPVPGPGRRSLGPARQPARRTRRQRPRRWISRSPGC